MAALWKLPIVFVVENNLWAIAMSHLRAASDPEIWKKGPPFGMSGVYVDGMDVLKVRGVAKEAIARARSGDGPMLVECETYRFRGHSLTDDCCYCPCGEHLNYAQPLCYDPFFTLLLLLLYILILLNLLPFGD